MSPGINLVELILVKRKVDIGIEELVNEKYSTAHDDIFSSGKTKSTD